MSCHDGCKHDDSLHKSERESIVEAITASDLLSTEAYTFATKITMLAMLDAYIASLSRQAELVHVQSPRGNLRHHSICSSSHTLRRQKLCSERICSGINIRHCCS